MANANPNAEPPPRRDPGATFRRQPATVGKPKPKAA